MCTPLSRPQNWHLAICNRHVGDPAQMTVDPAALLDPAYLDRLAARIDPPRAAIPGRRMLPAAIRSGSRAIDGEGCAVAYIQSLYFDFGSGVVLPETGILWQNRGISFTLDGEGPRALRPALCRFIRSVPRSPSSTTAGSWSMAPWAATASHKRRRRSSPDTPCSARICRPSVTAPRWLLGRRWANEGATLKLEGRFDPALVAQLRDCRA